MYNWQLESWPKATINRAALREELNAFTKAFKELKNALRKPQDLEVVARSLADEAVKTSVIEGVRVDESVVMSSICKVLGVEYAPKGFTKDARAEGVAQMMLAVRAAWDKPLSAALIKDFHKSLTAGEENRIAVGAFRSHQEPMRVIRQHADGTIEVRYEAPPSKLVPKEIETFVKMWKMPSEKPADIALRAAMLHPHFESIHPFEDGNGRVGRALVAKTLAEGLGVSLILPVSTIIARHRAAYYDEINEASRTLDWTNWAAFFIPVLTEVLTSFVQEGLGGPETRYHLNTPLREPIEGINEGISEWLIKLISTHPGVQIPYLKSVVGASTATVERAIAKLIQEGKIEHRGSKKTGGYYAI